MRIYKPAWTCGRYNAEHHAAIYYNNIAGMSYFLDEDSADVLAPIIRLKPNEYIEFDALCKETLTAAESLEPFVKQLEQLGFISTVPVTDEIAYSGRYPFTNSSDIRSVRW